MTVSNATDLDRRLALSLELAYSRSRLKRIEAKRTALILQIESIKQELGFNPCPLCRPDLARPAGHEGEHTPE